MGISDLLLPEFDEEMRHTRIYLERVPEDKLDWKPHEKSMTLGYLANHIAEIPSWVSATLTLDSLDLAPEGEEPWKPAVYDTTAEILAAFDAQVAEARGTFENTPDEAYQKPWSLLSGGQVYFTLPRITVIRSMVMNHLVHHRGQLSVYYRLNDIPVPAVYGPSADEGQM